MLFNISNSPDDFLFDIFIYYYSIVFGFKTKRPKVAYKKRLHGKSHWQKGLKSEFKLLYDVFHQRIHGKTQLKMIKKEKTVVKKYIRLH